MVKIANHLRTLAIVVLVLLTGSAFAATEAPELQQLRDQLKKSQDAEDKPAIIELSRRIVGIAPTIPRRGTGSRRRNLKATISMGWSVRSISGKKQSGDRRQQSKISARACASNARIISVQNSTGLRLSRPSRREPTWRPITTTLRNYAQSRRVGQTTRHTVRRQSRRRTQPRGACCVRSHSCAYITGTPLMPIWRKRTKWMPPIHK